MSDMKLRGGQAVSGGVRGALTMLTAFMGLTALACGLILATGHAEDVLRMNPDVLDGTPFSSFQMPGIILAVGVGGSQLLATAALRRGDTLGTRLALLAALVLLGWIVVQVILLGWTSPKVLQPFILVYSLIELAVVALAERAPGRRS